MALLNPAIGGPSVYPPAPAFLFVPPVSYDRKNWFESKGPDRYRRALYTFRYRSMPYPMLDTFDAPNGDSTCVRRSRSDTPLQALTTLNEPLSMETRAPLPGRLSGKAATLMKSASLTPSVAASLANPSPKRKPTL